MVTTPEKKKRNIKKIFRGPRSRIFQMGSEMPWPKVTTMQNSTEELGFGSPK
jgi:hypothetical protein